MAWVSHWMHHHLPSLWQFHAVHHSQTEMNVLSDNRQHVIETIVAATVAYLPARFLGLDTAQAGTLAISTIYVSAFIHTNIRTNLGPLRYVFVSPQAHRVHHSVEERHYDTNFGTVFSWWDYLFGTRYPGDHEYPPTGITDTTFPMERSANPVRVVTTWGAQTLHPFRGPGGPDVSAARDPVPPRPVPDAWSPAGPTEPDTGSTSTARGRRRAEVAVVLATMVAVLGAWALLPKDGGQTHRASAVAPTTTTRPL